MGQEQRSGRPQNTEGERAPEGPLVSVFGGLRVSRAIRPQPRHAAQDSRAPAGPPAVCKVAGSVNVGPVHGVLGRPWGQASLGSRPGSCGRGSGEGECCARSVGCSLSLVMGVRLPGTLWLAVGRGWQHLTSTPQTFPSPWNPCSSPQRSCTHCARLWHAWAWSAGCPAARWVSPCAVSSHRERGPGSWGVRTRSLRAGRFVLTPSLQNLLVPSL